MQARQLNILFFSFFIILFSTCFSHRANTISQPYGLFFVEANQLEEKKEISAADAGETLFIVTCYPFNALASGTPLRYVVSASQTIN